MTAEHNTLFLRLAGPMQSWGTSSRFQLRRTDAYPSKSGVLGLLLCAAGIPRQDSSKALEVLTPLLMGVRVDRPGSLDWDYHTAGAKDGILQAKGGIKVTKTTGKIETSVSQRQYLFDASFLVSIQGDPNIVEKCAENLQNPVWPLFLGRKCCVPGEPVFAGTGNFGKPEDALSSTPWRARIDAIDRDDYAKTRSLDVYLEHRSGSPHPGARLVYDVPKVFGFWSHTPRWVRKSRVTVAVGRQVHYSPQPRRAAGPDQEALDRRMVFDNYVCVFCKAPAEEVHHVTYERYGHELNEDLRSLCRRCHYACSSLEYGHDMRGRRIDPCDPALREKILNQINRLLEGGNAARRFELLTAARDVKRRLLSGPALAASEQGGQDVPISTSD